MTRRTILLAACFVALACSSEDTSSSSPSSSSRAGEAPPPADSVGDPPRSVRVPLRAAPPPEDGGSDVVRLHPQCNPREPFMCADSVGGFFCSSRPCLPDCTRMGCLGGRECKACSDGAHECVLPGGSC
jgi:hypothetical protein